MTRTNEEKGHVIVIVAPSGAGKSTLIEKIKRDFPNLMWSVSFTTRNIRPGEIDGKHYNFIQTDEFKTRIDKDDFIEWAEVHSNYYGTSKSFVEEKLDLGVSILLDLDVQGADALKCYFKDRATTIFIAPPSLEELAVRLKSRGTESTDVINLRLLNAEKEIIKKDEYDHCVINDELEVAYETLNKIIGNLYRGIN